MKVKEILYMMGVRPKQKTFGFEVVDIEVDGYGEVQWASWSNPNASPMPRLSDLGVLRHFIGEGDFVIDVGAHVGDTSLAPALLAGPSGLVLAMEPNPATFAILEANASLNRDRVSIDAVQVAAMPESGEYTFQYNDPSHINGGYQKGISLFTHASFFKVPVRGINLAKLLRTSYADRLPRLKYIKTDLEGGDHDAFKTFRGIVEEFMPVVQAELIGHRSTAQRREQVADLQDLGYDVFALRGETLESLEPLSSTHIDDGRTRDLFAVPPAYRCAFDPTGGLSR